MADRIEIRLLGRLYVRRPDGTVVQSHEWSTGKTTDLLRLLALNVNRPVPVSGLLEKLWPDADDAKARASLRTAASGIRKVLETDCIDRHLGGLVLHDAWVDVTAFEALVNESKAALRARDYPHVVALAREAEALYVDDFRAHDDRSAWASGLRESLRMSRQMLLADAGESAIELKWLRDAIDFSTLAIATDPCFERPHRTLMRAHAGLGETELALRAFEHCRANLAQELGADPSPQTRALHIEILSGEFEDPEVTPFTGREAELSALTQVVEACITATGCDVLCLSGAPGAGRTSLLDAAVSRTPRARLRQVFDDHRDPSHGFAVSGIVGDRSTDVALLGPLDGEPEWESARLTDFLSGLDPGLDRVIAIITTEETGDLLAAAMNNKPLRFHRVKVGTPSDADLTAIARAVLSGPATTDLMRALKKQSHGLAGRMVLILRDWISSGRIIWTSKGLDLIDTADDLLARPIVANEFRGLLEQLDPATMDLCQFLAVIDYPVTAQMMQTLDGFDTRNPGGPSEMQSKLERLSDLGILRLDERGFRFRNRALRDAFDAWLRPAMKVHLLHRIDRTFRRHLTEGGPDSNTAQQAPPTSA